MDPPLLLKLITSAGDSKTLSSHFVTVSQSKTRLTCSEGCSLQRGKIKASLVVEDVPESQSNRPETASLRGSLSEKTVPSLLTGASQGFLL